MTGLKKRILGGMVLGVMLPFLGSGLTLDEVHFWVGEGENRAMVVLDWGAVGGEALAWGVRWNGVRTVGDALKAMDREDGRLRIGFSSVGEVLVAGYDVGDEGWFSWMDEEGVWLQDSPMRELSDEGEYVLQYVGEEWPELLAPRAAESPYAVTVVTNAIETDRRFNRWNKPEAALGAPTRLHQIEGPLTSVIQAAAVSDVVSLVRCYDDENEPIPDTGTITVRFDHPVVDDPANPYGIDFLVFGNAFLTRGGGMGVPTNASPETVTVNAAAVVSEPGLVEVSQDGTNWYAYGNGPYADSWAPTLGYVYDPEHADRGLFAGNAWWSVPTDATRPVDPALTPERMRGKTVAAIAQLYEGATGGTGFDLTGFPLSVDARGRKWVQYVRVTSLTSDDDADWTELDAFADVSPAPAYENWLRAHVPIEDRVAGRGMARGALCANGRSNLENAMLGLAPDEVSEARLRIAEFRLEAGEAVFAVAGAANVQDMVRIEAREELGSPAWARTVQIPRYGGRDALGRHVFRVSVSARAASGFYRLLLE